MKELINKIIITGAGSAQANGVINCLKMANDGEEIIGLGSEPTDLIMCSADKKYLMPHSKNSEYKVALLNVLVKEKPSMIHFQHDYEIFKALEFRDEIEALGVKMLIPDNHVIDLCVHKEKTWIKFRQAGITVPNSILLNSEDDLKKAFNILNKKNKFIWLRSIAIGGGGKGALPVDNFNEASEWINKNNGWGQFIAAEMLTKRTVTWLSIWNRGELVVAQSRRREAWAHSNLTLSGVTGVTKIGETTADPLVDEIALKSIYAISKSPHGIFGVDMTYDEDAIPNPTEINISRFFTTIQFFAEAGLNMPKILKDIVLYNKYPSLERKINPLKNGLIWLRAMDCLPLLTTKEQIENQLLRP